MTSDDIKILLAKAKGRLEAIEFAEKIASSGSEIIDLYIIKSRTLALVRSLEAELKKMKP